MKKRGKILLLLVITFLFFQINFVFAEDDLLCLPCGDDCIDSESASSAYCLPSTIGEFECGVENGKCVIIKDDKVCCAEPDAVDRPIYRWRNQEECQSPEGAEFGVKIVDNNFCEDFDNPNFCRDECKDKYNDEETRSKCMAGCKTEDDTNHRCEDMNEVDCESAKDCESIRGSSLCEGNMCTTDMAWKGCRYKYDPIFDDLKKEYPDEEITGPGLTPDSPFYFLDGIFESREEKVSEIRLMIQEGNIEAAREALGNYKKYAEESSEEADPNEREEARRSAAAIDNALEAIENDISEENREEFVDDVRNKEGEFITAVEISTKIKGLCEQLAKLDPNEYDKMCKTNKDSSKWQRRLDQDLTVEQEKTAKEFVNVMKQCFKTSGQDCACEDITFYDFGVACSKAAPLATACDINKDEIACDELERLDIPDLPDWMQPIWEDLEGGMNEAQFNMHMPKECVEAGVTDPKECSKVMIKKGAPLECRRPLLDSGCETERECKDICEEIMFKLHTPQECIDKGVTDPKECGDFMDNFRGPGGPMEGGFGMDCMSIEEPMERLDCYDNKGNEMGEYYGPMDGEEGKGEITWQCKEHRIHWGPDCEKFMIEELPEIERMKMEEGDMRREQEGDWRVKEKECAASCDLQNGWWDFRDGECVCYATEGTGPKPGEYGGEGYEESECKDGCNDECPGASRTDCVNDRCECYYEDDGPQYAEGEGPGEPGDYDNNGDNGEEVVGYMPEQQETQSEEEPEQEQQEESEPEPEKEEPEPESNEDGEITGNAFLDYYYS